MMVHRKIDVCGNVECCSLVLPLRWLFEFSLRQRRAVDRSFAYRCLRSPSTEHFTTIRTRHDLACLTDGGRPPTAEVTMGHQALSAAGHVWSNATRQMTSGKKLRQKYNEVTSRACLRPHTAITTPSGNLLVAAQTTTTFTSPSELIPAQTPSSRLHSHTRCR
ncbi:hypothetical protein BAUCODRAFT_372298 [Baudoinia panamericana UAMH 10762]|uniref:Uncharacterized protein n=1 Tax=Baudoinia panamericana (strain UAMH 10762) TaxID=717646 RepID=M2MTP2_BAUPA|nr:uncharacterized protein BAUCODRAFT_372298 [Baudoinia panamericana UAMH 10762]EMD00282.1 hypothetical protein BAUCODRAFT_372298 [Baudoinia panamericana UAMH 10762]